MAQRRSKSLRSDAAKNRRHILDVAGPLLSRSANASMETVANEAGVSRGTLYRHFPTRGDLLAALNDDAHEAAEADRDGLRPPGELARATPTPLSVADVLNKVPPHLLGDQIVAEAQRVAGVSSAAIYLVDLEGTQLHRLAGPVTFPESVGLPLAVGTEVPREGLPAMRAAIGEHLPGAGSAPLTLRGRALGVLVAVGAKDEALRDLAYEAAAALDLADAYTDALQAARRTRATSPAAEIQQNLLPPRIVRTDGALIAGNVIPGYEIGGDWFDYAENEEGTWIGIADAVGIGARAAALGSVALGAFRSARHQGLGLAATVQLMHEAVCEVDMHGGTVTCTVGFWIPPTSSFSWVSCGELGPLVVAADGSHELLPATTPHPLGHRDGLGEVETQTRRLTDGDRLILASDGVLKRTSTRKEEFGVQGVVDAVRDAPPASAAGVVASVEATLRAFNRDELTDDATLAVLVPVLVATEDPLHPR